MLEAPYPILPYCLYHAVPMCPGIKNGDTYILRCMGCAFDELMRGTEPSKTIEIVITRDQYVQYGRIYDAMMAAKLPNVGKFGNEDLPEEAPGE